MSSLGSTQFSILKNLISRNNVRINATSGSFSGNLNVLGDITAGAIILTPGAVTQITSITTAVVLNNVAGVITTVSSTLAAVTTLVFTVTNSTVLASSAVVASVAGYSGTYTTDGLPVINVEAIAAGSFVIRLMNVHATAALDGILDISFYVVN